MRRARFVVSHAKPEDFQSGFGTVVHVYLVKTVGSPDWDEGVRVWVDKSYPRGRARVNCTNCSGLLSPMLSTCPHANAVRRLLSKENNATQ